MSSAPIKGRSYRVFATITIVTVYLVILAGGIVRSTGSGLGCPDWPRCFGRWVPPTQVSQLPLDYREKYAHGMPPEKVIFNPTKTWIEYVNRLLGALCGIFIVLAMVQAWRTYGMGSIAYMSAAAALLTAFQGWIGAKVVSTVLAPIMISVHMVLAQAIVFLLIAALWRSYGGALSIGLSKPMRFWAAILLVLFFSQMFMGIAVRQQVDYLINTIGMPKEYVVQSFTWIFYVHRSFSLALTGLVCYFAWFFFRTESAPAIKQLWIWSAALTLLEAILGASLYYLSLPALSQSLHLLLGSVILGLLFSIFLATYQTKRATATAI